MQCTCTRSLRRQAMAPEADAYVSSSECTLACGSLSVALFGQSYQTGMSVCRPGNLHYLYPENFLRANALPRRGMRQAQGLAKIKLTLLLARQSSERDQMNQAADRKSAT